jgi:hypothetical protein
LTQEDEHRDYRRRLKVKVNFFVMFERVRKNPRKRGCDCAVKISGTHANADQGKHVEAPIDNRAPRTHKEDTAAPEYDYCRQDKLNPLVARDWQQMIYAYTRKHLPNRQEKQWDCQHYAQPEF